MKTPLRWRSLLLGLLLPGAVATAAAPNLVLLMGDDHGWEEVGYNGHPHIKTPVLDEMAATGLRLDRFYAGAPSCSPTRGSFMTGRHPNRYGTFMPNWSIRPSEFTIGHLMQAAGYRTAHLGKWHLGPTKSSSPTNPGAMGFDEWLSHDNFFEIDPVLVRDGGEPEQFQGESSAILIGETIQFIERSRAQGQPFMAVVWFGSPHEPYAGLPEDLALYDDLPAEWASREVGLTSLATGQRVQRNLREVVRERFAEITAMDRAIGQLRDYLRETGLQQDTLLFYCGDNGIPTSGYVSSAFRAWKGKVYEGGVRVPGVMEWPARIPTPRVSTMNAVTSDLLPTLSELTGQSLPNRPIDGVSLLPMIEGGEFLRSRPILFWEFDVPTELSTARAPYLAAARQEGTTPLVKMMKGKYTRTFRNLHHPVIAETDFGGSRALLGNRFKLVVDGEEGSGVELFDIQQDPGETSNLASAMPARVAALREELRRWQRSILQSLTGADYP